MIRDVDQSERNKEIILRSIKGIRFLICNVNPASDIENHPESKELFINNLYI